MPGERTVNDAVSDDPEAGHDSICDQRQYRNGLLSSSKPAVLPANALRLHLDEPSAHHACHPDLCSTLPEAANNNIRPSRVRFRSRVRITSGFSHRRRKSDVGSSRSDSPSSSISAPLRSHSDDDTNTWGTLGKRVGLLALRRKILGSPKAQQRQKRMKAQHEIVDERTPLRNSFNHSPYVEGEGVQEGDVFDERLSHEVDGVFGKFPGRLLNYHVSSACFISYTC